jgi:hypothetical protein
MLTRTFAVILLGAVIGGCAAPNRYDWNQYDQRLYDYYKSPDTADSFVTLMERADAWMLSLSNRGCLLEF